MGFSLDGYRAEASALISSGVNGGYKKAAIVVSSRDIRNAGNKQKTAFLLSVLRNWIPCWRDKLLSDLAEAAGVMDSRILTPNRLKCLPGAWNKFWHALGEGSCFWKKSSPELVAFWPCLGRMSNFRKTKGLLAALQYQFKTEQCSWHPQYQTGEGSPLPSAACAEALLQPGHLQAWPSQLWTTQSLGKDAAVTGLAVGRGHGAPANLVPLYWTFLAFPKGLEKFLLGCLQYIAELIAWTPENEADWTDLPFTQTGDISFCNKTIQEADWTVWRWY